MPTPSNGSKIDRDTAERLVQNCYFIKNNNDGLVDGFLMGKGRPNAADFYGSSFNGYIFDAELITRFFSPLGSAKFLMVLIGADVQNNNIPTVVVTGCTVDPITGEFLTIIDDEPASEHPPKQFLATFPKQGTNANKIVIQML